LTQDGTWTYVYDGENRLQKMSKSGQTLTFTYDYAGRRIRKLVTGMGAKEVKYLWSGWKLAAELAADGSTVNRTFVWGPDFSDGRGQAGGAGSLLAQIDSSGIAYAVPDALGNIVGYADGNGAIVAAREFTPFGRVIAATSSSPDYPIGYSGQYTDEETGLVYYGLRYYSPRLGRFVNRDPIEEAGGNNLYAFVGNSPVNGWDVRGLGPSGWDWTYLGDDGVGNLVWEKFTDAGVEYYYEPAGSPIVLPKFDVNANSGTPHSPVETPDNEASVSHDYDDPGSSSTSGPSSSSSNPTSAPNKWPESKCKELAGKIASAQGALNQSLDAMNGGRSYLDMSRSDYVSQRMAPTPMNAADLISSASDSLSVAGAAMMPWGSRTETAGIILGGVSNITNTGLAGYAYSQGRYGDTLMYGTAAVTDLLSVASNTVPVLKAVTVPVDIGKGVLGASMILIDRVQASSAQSAAEATYGSHFDRMQSIEGQKRADISSQQGLYNEHCK
jgi:RHS repeat-associated protein